MASQQVLFAETIAGMKKAFKRRAYGELLLPSFAREPSSLTLAFQNPTPTPRLKAMVTEDTSSSDEPVSRIKAN